MRKMWDVILPMGAESLVIALEFHFWKEQRDSGRGFSLCDLTSR